jgi:uncharacterized membrane protein
MLGSLAERLRKSFISHIQGCDRYDILVALAILAYGIIFSYFTILKHYTFNSFATDLGVFDQAFYTTIFHGKLFYYTPELWINLTGYYFGVHFSPILFTLLPIYAIYPSPESLLVAQSFLLAIAAMPLYLLSKALLKSKKTSFALVVAYLLFTPLHGANWFDFHPQAFIPLLIFSLYYFFIKKSWKLYLVSVILTLMIQEHLPFILFVVALCNILAMHSKSMIKFCESLKKFGNIQLEDLKTNLTSSIKNLFQLNPTSVSVLTIVLSVGWYLLTNYVKGFYPINPMFLEIYRAVDAFEVLGFTEDILLLPVYIALNPQRIFEALMFDAHIKFIYLILLFGPLLFLSFKSKFFVVILFILLPKLLTNYLPYYTVGAQYPLYLTPFIFIAAVEGVSTIYACKQIGLGANLRIRKKSLERLIPNIIVVSVIFTIFTSPLSPFSYEFGERGIFWYPSPFFMETDDVQVDSLHSIIDLIPSDSSVLTQNNLFPHVSSRIKAYLVPFDFSITLEETNKEYMTNYTNQLIDKSEFILLDTRLTDYWTTFVFEEALSGHFGVRASTHAYILFEKSYEGMSSFAHEKNYEVYLANRDLISDPRQLTPDTTSKSGTVVVSKKGIPSTFVYGPYNFLPAGIYNVTFEVKVQEQVDGYIGKLDVTKNQGTSIISKRDIYGFEMVANEWANFTLSLTSTSFKNGVEFRAFSSGLTNVYVDRIIVERVPAFADVDFGSKTFTFEDLQFSEDYLSEEGFLVHPANTTDNFFWYGPYVSLPVGDYQATFFLKATQQTQDAPDEIITLDIASDFGENILAEHTISSSSLTDTNSVSEWQGYTLNFSLENSLENAEFRGLNPSSNYTIYLAFIHVERIN